MWGFYFLISLLSAGVILKVVHPLIGRSVHPHGLAVSDRRLAAVIILFLPVLTLAFYLYLGRPDLKGTPALLDQYRELNQRHLALLAEQPAKILIEKNPEDLGAVLALAEINLRLKNYPMAIKFYALGADIAHKLQDWRERPVLTALLETQVEGASGTVTEEALDTIARIRAMHPQNPLAGYFAALHKAQTGNIPDAISEWRELLSEGNPEIYWKVRVREKISEYTAQMNPQ